MPIPSPEIHCLAQVIHHEARGESRQGQEAVAQVVINRTKSHKFPKTICGVVNQPHQFTNFTPHIHPSPHCMTVAASVVFQATKHRWLYFNTTGPKHATRIGNHLFW